MISYIWSTFFSAWPDDGKELMEKSSEIFDKMNAHDDSIREYGYVLVTIYSVFTRLFILYGVYVEKSKIISLGFVIPVIECTYYVDVVIIQGLRWF